MNPTTFGESFAAGLTLTALLIAVTHWFPWPAKLHRLAAYAIGVTAILAGAGVWLRDSLDAWLGMAAFAAAAGVVTGACYLVDAILRWRVRARVRDGRDD